MYTSLSERIAMLLLLLLSMCVFLLLLHVPPSLRQLEKIAVMIVSMLMHRLEISVMFCMVLIQAIALFPFVLWESVKSIIFLDVAFISLISSWLIRHLFLWGRKMDGLTEFASSSRLVTFSVAKFP